MGKRTHRIPKSYTLPSSPTHSFSSSSSSDFEFTISISPRKSTSNICPADELFYKGQLLPLHLSPRLSMVRTLLASSSTSSSSDTTTTASRDSSGSSTDSQYSLLAADCDSSRPSSVAEDDEFKRLNANFSIPSSYSIAGKKAKYFSLSRFSSVFRKPREAIAVDGNNNPAISASSVKRMSVSAKEVIRKYLKKAKPLYDKLSQRTRAPNSSIINDFLTIKPPDSGSVIGTRKDQNRTHHHHSVSFSGNLSYPKKRNCVASCPSSMRSSPSHSGVLYRSGSSDISSVMANSSSMEELQSAIQGAIAHCKNSMMVPSKDNKSSNDISIYG